MNYLDLKKSLTDLIIDEVLEIPEIFNCNDNINRKEKIEKLSEYINKIKYYPWYYKENTKIIIRYYNKNNEHNSFETDTARGKEMPTLVLNDNKNVFVYTIDNDGNIHYES